MARPLVWAERAPDRLVYSSNESGTYELYTWDRTTGERRQITKRKEGTLRAVVESGGATINLDYPLQVSR